MKKLKTIQVKTLVDSELYAQFKDALKNFGEGQNTALRQAIRDFIKKEGEKTTPPQK